MAQLPLYPGWAASKPVPFSEAFFSKPVKDYMRKKFYILKAEETASGAVKVMKDNNLGSVGVRFDDGSVGILTDRDILMKVVSESLEPSKVKLQDISVRNPVTVNRDASLGEALKLMREEGILRLIWWTIRAGPWDSSSSAGSSHPSSPNTWGTRSRFRRAGWNGTSVT